MTKFSVVLVFGLAMVKVALAVPLYGMVNGDTVVTTVGASVAVPTAVAATLTTLKLDVTEKNVLSGPTIVGVTPKTTKQDAPAANPWQLEGSLLNGGSAVELIILRGARPTL